MNKDYIIRLEEKDGYKVSVYLEPHSIKIESKSLFSINLGFINLDASPNTFHCIDSDRMTLEVMTSISSKWMAWEKDRNKMPI
tara:strand:+ start:361 stop:609 length:249 start_codon:yes stop_codon:yes gene_type:complete